MKLFYAIFFTSLSTLAFAQAADSTKTKLKVNPYASIGLSIGHVDPNDPNIDNFNKASFPSIEAGVMGENISLGAVFGYENFFAVSSARKFYELKRAFSNHLVNAVYMDCSEQEPISKMHLTRLLNTAQGSPICLTSWVILFNIATGPERIMLALVPPMFFKVGKN